MNEDDYPGDVAYTQIVQTIYQGVTSDSISMAGYQNGTFHNRNQIAQLLVGRHNTSSNSGQPQTNADFLGIGLNVQDVVQALTYTQGYISSAEWDNWAGQHSGVWYDTAQQFIDNASWFPPVDKQANDPNDLDSNGQPRLYSFQKVEFLDQCDNIKRTGWNQSNVEVKYLWGWDPKEQGAAQGQIGSNVGFPFVKNGLSVIVWFSPQEAFLECISLPATGIRKRTSTGLWGFGQWTVS